MLHLLRLISRRELIPALVAGLLAALTGLGLMGASAWLITWASFSPPLYTLTLGITCVRACGLSRAVFRYLERYLSHRLAFRAYGQLQQKVYARAEAALPLLAGLTAQGDWLQQLISGCAILRDSYVRALLPLSVTALLTVTGCCALAMLSLPAACLLAAIYCIHFLCWPVLPAPAAQAASYRDSLLELADGRDELITAGSSPLYLQHLSREASNYQAGTAKQKQRLDWLETGLAMLRAAGLALLLALLSAVARTGQITGIELAVWLLLLLTLLQEYTALLPALMQLHEAGPALTNICPEAASAPKDIFEEALPEPVTEPDSCLLKVSALDFAYPGQAPLFQGLSFSVNTGQHTVIIGESGSGKTTLACLLAGLYTAGPGQLLSQGLALDKPRPDLLAACLQGCYVFSTSIRNNFLRLCPELAEADMLDCLACAQFLPVLESLPGGLDEPLGEDAARLSGGERLRLLTALALARPAPLLLLDEPTASLDKKTASGLLDALFARATKHSQTLLIITHDLPQTDRFAQIINLRYIPAPAQSWADWHQNRC